MKRRVSTMAMMIVGSYFVYCGSSSMGTLDGGDANGLVDDAEAAECCSAPALPAPTTIFDGMVTGQDLPTTSNCGWLSPSWDVSAYRKVVIHTGRCPGGRFFVQGKNGIAGFVALSQTSCGDDQGAGFVYDPTLGRELRLNFGINAAGELSACSGGVPVTIVGYPSL